MSSQTAPTAPVGVTSDVSDDSKKAKNKSIEEDKTNNVTDAPKPAPRPKKEEAVTIDMPELSKDEQWERRLADIERREARLAEVEARWNASLAEREARDLIDRMGGR